MELPSCKKTRQLGTKALDVDDLDKLYEKENEDANVMVPETMANMTGENIYLEFNEKFHKHSLWYCILKMNQDINEIDDLTNDYSEKKSIASTRNQIKIPEKLVKEKELQQTK